MKVWQYYHAKSGTWITTCPEHAELYTAGGIPVRHVEAPSLPETLDAIRHAGGHAWDQIPAPDQFIRKELRGDDV